MAPRSGSPTPSSSGRTGLGRPDTPASGKEPVRVKMPLPDTYDGSRAKLKAFLMQSELYIGFNGHMFANEPQKVLWAASFMRGRAFDWIQTFTADHLANLGATGPNGAVLQADTRDDETKILFYTWGNFKTRINRMFGDIDEERTAEEALGRLKQKGATTAYAAEFQQHSFKTGWNEDSLKYAFYKGLKDSVKDDMSHMEKRPETLQAMITQAILIDNRLYERALERKGQYRQGNFKKGQQRQRWPEAMEIDSDKQGPRLSKEELDRRRKNKLCFECGKEGHRASFHRQSQKKPNGKGQGRPPGKQLHAAMQINMVNSEEWNSPDEDGWVADAEYSDEWESIGNGSEREDEKYDLTASEERQITEMIRQEEGVLIRNKKAFRDEKAQKRNPADDATHPDHLLHGTLSYRAYATEICRYHWEEKDRKSYHPSTVKPVWVNSMEQQGTALIAQASIESTVDRTRPEKGKAKEEAPREGDPLENIIDLPENGEEYVVWNIFPTDGRRVMRRTSGTPGHYITSIGWRLGCGPQVGDKLTVFHVNRSRVGWKKETETTWTPYMEMLRATEPSRQQLLCDAVISGEKIPAMIDSGATGNFICSKTVEWESIRTQKKRRPYKLGLIDGSHTTSEVGWVTTETVPLLMKVVNHEEWIQFDDTC